MHIISMIFCLTLYSSLAATKGRACAEESAASGSRTGAASTEQPDNDRIAQLGNIRAGRILFLGNSITLHGPSAAVS
jgi:hypothetical protein